MKPQNTALLLLFGLAFWTAGTIFYRLRGPHIFESTNLRYWINCAILSAAVCILLLKLRNIPDAQWASAALLICLPGMFGESVLLSNFATFMPRMSLSSSGRFGALLFASYALFLTICEVVTLRATQASTP